MKCSKCGSDATKAGHYGDLQRYKCPKCNYKFYHGLYMAPKYIEHFGLKIKDKNIKLSRENYAVINKKNSFLSHDLRREEEMKAYAKSNSKALQKIAKDYFAEKADWKEIFEDETCARYNDEFCLEHQKNCLLNFDLNMKYFKSLKAEEFNDELKKILKEFNCLKKITDLNCCDYAGVYILVLDDYNQIYIGKTSQTIKKRIRTHWTSTKEFDRLIFGDIYDSILSIDSFGALDTTRIFACQVECSRMQFDLERKIENSANKKFILNRIQGGDITLATHIDKNNRVLS